jgi:hypothetical protein
MWSLWSLDVRLQLVRQPGNEVSLLWRSEHFPFCTDSAFAYTAAGYPAVYWGELQFAQVQAAARHGARVAGRDPRLAGEFGSSQ